MPSEEGGRRAGGLLGALADRRRRGVVAYLSERSDDVATFAELADHVRSEHAPDADPDRVAIDLHHVTLPKLEEVGLVEYDTRSERVRYHPSPAAEELLAVVGEMD